MDMDANCDTLPSHAFKTSSASPFLRGASLGVDNAQPRPPATPTPTPTPTAPTAALRASEWTVLAPLTPKKDQDEEQNAGTEVMAMAMAMEAPAEVNATQCFPKIKIKIKVLQDLERFLASKLKFSLLRIGKTECCEGKRAMPAMCCRRDRVNLAAAVIKKKYGNVRSMFPTE